MLSNFEITLLMKKFRGLPKLDRTIGRVCPNYLLTWMHIQIKDQFGQFEKIKKIINNIIAHTLVRDFSWQYY